MEIRTIKILHEAPLELMDHVKQFTDGDYCLPHLLDQEPKYLEYFLKAKSEGRYIMMDNSLHELGESYDKTRLLYWVNELKPNDFFIPDVWEDRVSSVVKAREWFSIKFPEGVDKIAIIQANSFEDAAICLETYKVIGYKKFAFSYGASYYNEIFPHPNIDIGKALGRVQVISKLYKFKILHPNDYVHLLGASIPREFFYYKGIDCVKSLDTSNPVMAALDGEGYYKHYGLDKKPKSNMNNSFYINKKDVNMEILNLNLEMFKKINNL